MSLPVVLLERLSRGTCALPSLLESSRPYTLLLILPYKPQPMKPHFSTKSRHFVQAASLATVVNGSFDIPMALLLSAV